MAPVRRCQQARQHGCAREPRGWEAWSAQPPRRRVPMVGSPDERAVALEATGISSPGALIVPPHPGQRASWCGLSCGPEGVIEDLCRVHGQVAGKVLRARWVSRLARRRALGYSWARIVGSRGRTLGERSRYRGIWSRASSMVSCQLWLSDASLRLILPLKQMSQELIQVRVDGMGNVTAQIA